MIDQLSTAELIKRGKFLQTQVELIKNELKQIDEEILSRALAMPHEPLVDGYREGRRATLSEGDEKITVLFESDVLRESFTADSEVADAVLPMMEKSVLNELFSLKRTYERRIKDGHKFRLRVASLLDEENAAKLIDGLKSRDKNGIVKSRSVVEWGE